MEKNRVGDKPTSRRAQTVAKLRLLSDKHLVSDFHFLHVIVFDLFLLAFTYFSYGLIFFVQSSYTVSVNMIEIGIVAS